MSSTTYPTPTTAAPSAAAAVTQPRRATFDVARLLAAYSIVWLHTPWLPSLQASKSLGRVAVPFFIFASVHFVFEGLRRRPERTFARYAASRLVRIYVPFLAWSGIYLAFKLVKGLLLPDQPNHYPGIEILWTGGFYHLWFMPFILAVNLLAFAVAKATAGRPSLEKTVCRLAILAGIVLAAAPAPEVLRLAGPSAVLAANALPAVCWAVALAIALRHTRRERLETSAAAIAGVGIVVASTAWMWHTGDEKLAASLAGLGLMLVALRPRSTPWMAGLAKLGPLAYGIYLSHLLFIKTLESLAANLSPELTWQRDVSIFLLAATLSTLLARALSRRRATRWLVA